MSNCFSETPRVNPRALEFLKPPQNTSTSTLKTPQALMTPGPRLSKRKSYALAHAEGRAAESPPSATSQTPVASLARQPPNPRMRHGRRDEHSTQKGYHDKSCWTALEIMCTLPEAWPGLSQASQHPSDFGSGSIVSGTQPGHSFSPACFSHSQ